jgi:glycosyltransferase involved in cell wall biosynthesis
MTNRVNFYGYVNDIRQVWANNHIQLMPSISEGTPLALQEAMLCGRTAVITDVGGNADLVGLNGERGFLANAPSIRSFSEAMEHAWLHRENWQTLGFNAHHYVSDRVDQNPETKLLQYLCGQKN